MIEFLKNLFGAVNPEVKEALKNGAFLVDVRTKAEFDGGSAAGAVNIPLDRVADSIAKFKNKKQIVVFCHSGARSGQAKRILEQNGIENVLNGGGINSILKTIEENG
ncbi:MAG: rhodanese-like domain-containing protein [Flavobacteriia bacterium]|nr:rhodanese-like domain-containing protein [Flavobacteriia bacterium]